jgi:Phage Terminase
MTPARPRWATPRTPDRPTRGRAAARLAAALGLPPMPWQRQVFDTALEFDPATGEWRYPTVVLSVQRQAGKTALIGPMACERCLTGVDRKTWYTAQTRGDARDNWMDVTKLVRRSPLGDRVKIRESNGSEAITFPNGSTYRIFAPAEDALHGKANALVVIDEGWAMTETRGDELMQAIVPTFATVPGQLWIVSTMGPATSAWFHGLSDAGRLVAAAGRTDTLAYFEWSIPDDADPTDLDAVAAAHPASGYTLRPQALRQAAATMKPGEFARAYGNRRTGAGERVIPAPLWLAGADPHPVQPARGTVSVGFDVGLDERDAAIVAGWRDEAGGHVEVVDARPGVSWLVPRLLEVVGRWSPLAVVHDGAGPVLAAADAYARAGGTAVATTTRDYAVACSNLLAAVVDGTLRHTPDEALDAAAAAAVKRRISDGGWGWGRRGSAGSIAALVAATVALWAVDHCPPPAPFVIR